jgi:PAS domain S-box-containing protein
MTGFTADALKGHAPAMLNADASDGKKITRWCSTAKAGRPLSGEGHLVRKDGAAVHAAWNFSVIPTGRGSAIHVVGTYRDTTEKRRLQEALVHAQRLDAVGRLAGGVAHDFNNLLSVINGYSQILATQVRSQPKVLKEVEEIHQAGLKAAALTRQLLAFGRRQPLKMRVLNLNRFIRMHADILARVLGDSRRLDLQLGVAAGHIRVDPTQFQQVLLNLVLNSRDALGKGGTVTISTGRRIVKPGRNRRITDAGPGRYVFLAVKDDGVGMSDDTQRQLFEPFFTTKPEGKGSGLGLSLVHGIVQQCGGMINVRSELGRGSTFEILIPETTQREDPIGPRSSVDPIPTTGGHETVVLVEEDDVVRKMVTGILTADGYRVIAVKNAAAALREVRHLPQPAQLLIANLNREGTALAETLRAAGSGLRLLSTSPKSGALPAGIKSTHLLHLPKPYALSDLLKAARTLLDA